ncbi:MAG: hypothetical protein IPL25_19220 [Saprospiraceae bacterium]|nr:hypothetical protein [Candidatus Vicinibacter affinis]
MESTLFTLWFSHEIQSQSVCQELRLWIDKLSKVDQYEQDINYTVYKDHVSQDVLENECGKLYRNKNTFRMEILGNLIIQDTNLQVQINEEDRMIAISEATPIQVTSFADIEKWLGLSIC